MIEHNVNKKTKRIAHLMIVWQSLLSIPYILSFLGIGFLSSVSSYYNIFVAMAIMVYLLYLRKKCRVSVLRYIMLLLLIQIISIILNGSIGSLILSLSECIMVYIMLDAFLSDIFKNTELSPLWDFVIVFGLILCVANIIINGINTFSFWATNTSLYSSALSSIFGNKNTWGQFLLPPCMIAIFQFCWTGKKKYMLAFLVLLWNLFTSFSRTSVACLVIFVCLFILLFKKWNIKKICLIFLLIMFTVIILNLDVVSSFINSFYRTNDNGFTGRTDLWEIGLNAFSKHPFVGVGMGRSPSILAGRANVEEFHNEFIEILVAGGFLKFFLIMGVLLSSLHQGFGLFKKNRIHGAFCVSAWVSFMVYMFFESFQLFGRSLVTVIPTFVIISLPQILNKQCDMILGKDISKL